MQTNQTPAGNGARVTRTTRQQLRQVTDGTTTETLGESLNLLSHETYAIENLVSLANKALGISEDSHDRESVQAALIEVYNRLSVVAEELERLSISTETAERTTA